MDVNTLIIIALFILLVSIWLTSGKSTKKQLPGPIGLPIVGYIPFMTKKPYVKLAELSKTYGPLYKVRLGSIDIIVITDFEIMKEAFSKDAFMGRPPDLPFELSQETISTGAFNDIPWKEQRRFSLHMLRDLGFGKTKMEEHIKVNIHSLYISRDISEEMKKHEETLDPNNVRDFIDGYLLEIQKRSNDPNTTFRREVLADLARAFFAAGSDTVRVTVDWMLLVSAAYPQVQKRIQAEIDEVIGPDRFPTWQDRLSMPFTEAAIIELMRWRTIVPLNIMRYTLQDTELNGYYIPKHSRVLSVMWAVDNDTKLWGNDVEEYKPERMLSKDGKKVVKPEYAIPFSIGKRSCPGKSFAEIEVFLYLVAILQKFEVSTPPGKTVDLEADLGISLQPRRQDLCLKLRH
ncbi:cytochrome P450 1A2 [Trichonephila inaurata madagascariensis]|uniref:Cytochrome P450 1A2 n=1 Tax=Trichonephila inaurata madagascariensis TaxID=2747483 RepID=A0A8X6YST9_9ARAC|nr:cytochrome P450 1A2 [Trichonephila inaurata madagascariensis]